MAGLTGGLTSGISERLSSIEKLSGNPVVTAIGGAVAGGLVVGTVAAVVSRRKKSTRKASSKKRRKASAKRKVKKRSYKYARTAGKRKDTSSRRIRMTKNGQPYVILKSGKARFIKKTSARTSRKRKGGRY